MGTTRPVSVRAALNSSMIRARSLLLDPGGIRSSSWKVMPYAPSSASLCTASTAARTGRVASPNRSRACQPTVHRPKLNLSSRAGLIDIGVHLAGVGCVISWRFVDARSTPQGCPVPGPLPQPRTEENGAPQPVPPGRSTDETAPAGVLTGPLAVTLRAPCAYAACRPSDSRRGTPAGEAHYPGGVVLGVQPSHRLG